MWPLKGRGGRQVAVGHFIVLIDNRYVFCSVLLWVDSRPFYFHHRNFLLMVVGEHVLLIISSHTAAVNPCMSHIFNFSFFDQSL